jgi:hypothetical protein
MSYTRELFFRVYHDRLSGPHLGCHRLSNLLGPSRQNLLARPAENFYHAALGFIGPTQIPFGVLHQLQHL